MTSHRPRAAGAGMTAATIDIAARTTGAVTLGERCGLAADRAAVVRLTRPADCGDAPPPRRREALDREQRFLHALNLHAAPVRRRRSCHLYRLADAPDEGGIVAGGLFVPPARHRSWAAGSTFLRQGRHRSRAVLGLNAAVWRSLQAVVRSADLHDYRAARCSRGRVRPHFFLGAPFRCLCSGAAIVCGRASTGRQRPRPAAMVAQWATFADASAARRRPADMLDHLLETVRPRGLARAVAARSPRC